MDLNESNCISVHLSFASVSNTYKTSHVLKEKWNRDKVRITGNEGEGCSFPKYPVDGSIQHRFQRVSAVQGLLTGKTLNLWTWMLFFSSPVRGKRLIFRTWFLHINLGLPNQYSKLQWFELFWHQRMLSFLKSEKNLYFKNLQCVAWSFSDMMCWPPCASYFINP